MHDFQCTNADDMLNAVLAKEVRYMKETEEGRASMCEMMEQMLERTNEAGRAEGRAEGIAEYQRTTVENMIARGYRDDEICAVTGVSAAKVAEIRGGRIA